MTAARRAPIRNSAADDSWDFANRASTPPSFARPRYVPRAKAQEPSKGSAAQATCTPQDGAAKRAALKLLLRNTMKDIEEAIVADGELTADLTGWITANVGNTFSKPAFELSVGELEDWAYLEIRPALCPTHTNAELDCPPELVGRPPYACRPLVQIELYKPRGWLFAFGDLDHLQELNVGGALDELGRWTGAMSGLCRHLQPLLKLWRAHQEVDRCP